MFSLLQSQKLQKSQDRLKFPEAVGLFCRIIQNLTRKSGQKWRSFSNQQWSPPPPIKLRCGLSRTELITCAYMDTSCYRYSVHTDKCLPFIEHLLFTGLFGFILVTTNPVGLLHYQHPCFLKLADMPTAMRLTYDSICSNSGKHVLTCLFTAMLWHVRALLT